MKKTILNFSDSGLSKKLRMMLGAFMVAFFAMGLQSAQAQYLPLEEAVDRLGTEIMVIHNATSVDAVVLEVNAPVSQQLQMSYYEGAAVQMKETMDVQQAIDANHVSFLERFPTATAKANQYRAEVEAIIAE